MYMCVIFLVYYRIYSPLICSSVPLSNNPNNNSSDVFDDDNDSMMSWSEKAKKNLATDPQRIYDEFGSAVDFIVAAGPINSSGVSTVIDCMSNPAKVIRLGMGSLATLDMQVDTSTIE
jgi:tRNA A37 threonylcarbamoyladenosine synthetase subunit TsaC/SUA5/YrdC